MKTEFLKWLDHWEGQIESREDLDTYEKERRQLSRETLEGIRITGTSNKAANSLNLKKYLQTILFIPYLLVYSFIELVQDLFTDEHITSFLSKRIQQDPLEKYFGKQRQRGRVNENPSVGVYEKRASIRGDKLNQLRYCKGEYQRNKQT